MAIDVRTRLNDLAFRALRAAFRVLPLTEHGRDRLRRRFFDRYPDIRPSPVEGLPAAPGAARRARTRSDVPAVGFVERSTGALPSPLPATVVAFYLPQFHPIPENDAWWGRGFTEWRNVTRALPQFEGHAQPRLPGELGFYDLRNTQVMRNQAALARDYGIGAFCFYFYWFQGRRLLEAPLEAWLEDRSITLPFCLCWANESWSRRWDGRAGDVLMEQAHDAADDIAFIAHVARYLRDPRYLRVDGKPLLLVYRTELMPDPAATAERWRAWCRENGIGEIAIACVQGFGRPDPRDIGFDAAVEFPPNLASPTNITADHRLLDPDYAGEVLDWRELADDYSARPLPAYRLFAGVNCGWDNEPRRPGRGRTYLHAAPRRYRDWLQHTIEHRLAGAPPGDRLVFVNAWNEWAEGAVLEPDARLGHAWLQATRAALQRATSDKPRRTRPCVVVQAWDMEAFDEILAELEASGLDARLVVTTAPERESQARARLAARGVVAELAVAENRGRDILPFLRAASRLLDEDEDVVLKLHTKRSTHRADGDCWRRELLASLLGAGRVPAILDAFAGDSGLGMVAPEGHIQPLGYYWGANEHAVRYLAARAGLPQPDVENDTFVAGSMFWCRLEALRPLLDAHFDEWEFEQEAGQLDGTFAHAVERAFSLAIRAAGYRVRTIAETCGEAGARPGKFPYAELD